MFCFSLLLVFYCFSIEGEENADFFLKETQIKAVRSLAIPFNTHIGSALISAFTSWGEMSSEQSRCEVLRRLQAFWGRAWR
jgi:hypothetical protein